MRNYWPLGIFLLAMVVVGLIILTLKVAITNPVELQGMCGINSQEMDENANEIAKKRKEFLEKYQVNFAMQGKEVFVKKKNTQRSFMEIAKSNFTQLELLLRDINKNPLQDEILKKVEIEFFLTRPHTTREDKRLGLGKFENGLWKSQEFVIDKDGRYQSEALVKIGEDSICITQEYSVLNVD